LILTLYLTRTTLLNQVDLAGEGARPNLVFFDIQDDQIEPFTKLAAEQRAPVMQSAPIVTMEIATLKGRPVEEIMKDRPGRRDPEAADGDTKAGDTERRPPATKAGGGPGGRGGPRVSPPACWAGVSLDLSQQAHGHRSAWRRASWSTRRSRPGAAVVPISVEEVFVKISD